MAQTCILTPLGDITMTEEDEALVAVDWGQGAILESTPFLDDAARQ